jgi:hypothetical protein
MTRIRYMIVVISDQGDVDDSDDDDDGGNNNEVKV